jgi:hypothetical protein
MDDRMAPAIADRALIGVGLYSLSEAERLTRVPASGIRRWLFGYRYRQGEVGPVWHGQIDPVDDTFALGFLDLIEIRFVHAFRQHGVGWRVIRDATKHAAEILGSDHPFATWKFRTDGKRIFAELGEATGDPVLIDSTRSQFAFHAVVAPSLYKGLEFSGEDEAVRWFPMWPKRQVVIVLAKAVEVEKSVERVARWYAVSLRAVKAAVEFEQRLAARDSSSTTSLDLSRPRPRCPLGA